MSPKAGKKASFPAGRLSGKRNSPLLGIGSVILFYSVVQLITYGPPILGRAIIFTQFIELNVNLTKNTLMYVPRITLNQISGHLVVQSS